MNADVQDGIQTIMLPEPFVPPDSPEPEFNPEYPSDDPIPGVPEPEQTDAVATPEGDNETRPGQPLTGGVPTPVRPPGDGPHTDEPLYPTAY